MFNELFIENRAVYEIMWKNVVEWGRPQMAKWRTRIACWIPKATDTHSEYVILIDFPQQRWLHERVSMSSYMYITSLALRRKKHVSRHPSGAYNARLAHGFF